MPVRGGAASSTHGVRIARLGVRNAASGVGTAAALAGGVGEAGAGSGLLRAVGDEAATQLVIPGLQRKAERGR